jgi:hypothetical protein
MRTARGQYMDKQLASDGAPTGCLHTEFTAVVKMVNIEDTGRRMLEVGARCTHCGHPVQFLGVPAGFKYSGPSVSIDALELSVPVCMQGEQPNPMQLMLGKSLH